MGKENTVYGDAADISYMVGKLRGKGIKVKIVRIKEDYFKVTWPKDVKLVTT